MKREKIFYLEIYKNEKVVLFLYLNNIENVKSQKIKHMFST